MEASFSRRDFTQTELTAIVTNPSVGLEKIRMVYAQVDLVVKALMVTDLFNESMKDAEVVSRLKRREYARRGIVLGFEVLGREVMEYFLTNNNWSIPFLIELAHYQVEDAYEPSPDVQANLLFDLIFEVSMNYFPTCSEDTAADMLENLPIYGDEDLHDTLCEDITESILSIGKLVVH